MYGKIGRRDKNEREIISTLKSIGAEVYQLHAPCDLLVLFRGKNFLIEIKNQDGVFTPEQKKFMRTCKGAVSVARTPKDALKVIGVT